MFDWNLHSTPRRIFPEEVVKISVLALSQAGTEIPDHGVMFASDDGRHVEDIVDKRPNWYCETRTYVLQYSRDRRNHQTCAGLFTSLPLHFNN
jgi:hypothetical protein